MEKKNWIVKDIDFTISKPCFCDTPNPGVFFFFFAYVQVCRDRESLLQNTSVALAPLSYAHSSRARMPVLRAQLGHGR